MKEGIKLGQIIRNDSIEEVKIDKEVDLEGLNGVIITSELDNNQNLSKLEENN
jgi:hypothetical protein